MIFKGVLGALLALGGYYIFMGVWNVMYPEDISLAPLPEDAWWGVRKPEEIKNDKIRPFTISTPSHVLEHLKNRLNYTKFPNRPLKDVNFEYGFNLDYLQKIRSYWLHDYDWNVRLKYLNSMPHFKTTISGLDIHFIHIKPNVTPGKSLKIIPILLLHNWPGSVVEFYEMIPHLIYPKKNYDFVFEVVAPSHPGFGYSEAPVISGLRTAQIGVIYKKLMRKLGHEEFYIHGGDVGYFVGRDMSLLYPKDVLGFHSQMCGGLDYVGVPLTILGNYYPFKIFANEFERRFYANVDPLLISWMESGYMHLQVTKPDTLGMALLDSPIGLAGYILEKFAIATNPDSKSLPDGGLTRKFSLEALFDNIMIYWTTRSILTSIRLYKETLSIEYWKLRFFDGHIKVPTACAMFPYDPLFIPEATIRRKFKNIVKVSYFNDGGHYASFELPDLVANDIWDSIPLFDKAQQKVTS